MKCKNCIHGQDIKDFDNVVKALSRTNHNADLNKTVCNRVASGVDKLDYIHCDNWHCADFVSKNIKEI